jgi:hypothetical protein
MSSSSFSSSSFNAGLVKNVFVDIKESELQVKIKESQLFASIKEQEL